MVSPAAEAKPYRRRLSSEERREGFILVEKRWLSLFPPRGDRFKVRIGQESLDTALKAIPCTCRGPDKPHEHYHIPLTKLDKIPKGSSVTLTRLGTREYRLALA